MQPVYTMDAIIQYINHTFIFHHLLSLNFLFRISSIDQYDKLLNKKSNKNQLIMDNLDNKHYLLCQEILQLLDYGLKERINLICPLPSFRQTIKTVSFLSLYFIVKNRTHTHLRTQTLLVN